MTDGWKQRTIGTLGDWRGGSTPSKANSSFWKEYGIPWVSPKDMQAGVIEDTEDKLTIKALSSSSLQVFDPGDVAVVFRSGILRHSFPVATMRCPFTVNQDIKVLSPAADIDKRFAFHTLRGSGERILRTAVKSGTTVESVDFRTFAELPVSVPSLPEQHRIAEILDTIDAAIRATEALIAKLKQAKAGLLHDLLTRGIDEHGHLRDPDARPEQFKGSPLGRIPREWEVHRLDDLCSHIVDCPHTTPEIESEGVLMVRTSEVRDGAFDAESAPRVSSKDYRVRVARLEPVPGDVVFTREAPVGEAFVIPRGMRVCLGQRTMLLRSDPNQINANYLIAQVYSGAVRSRIEQSVAGTTNPHLNVGDVRAFSLPVPPLSEQLWMSQIIESQSNRIIDEERNRDKAKQIKQGLMDDLLTGRLRVGELHKVVV